MDEIKIKNLEVFGHHGVYQEENVLGQKFLVDAVLGMSTRKAGQSDELEDSVSYGDVSRLIRDEMTRQNDKLLERVAERLAEAILLQFSLVDRVKITVKKPWAPIRMHVDYTAVSIERSWHKVYIGVGSNLGDREGYLELAKRRLQEDPHMRRFRQASIIETEPYGYVEQPNFLNTIFEMETLLEPEELLSLLQQIEQDAGRERKIHWGPRTLDLDLLLYDHLVTEEEHLVIPHPEICQRLFVLTSLCELYPYGIHPVTNERFCDIKSRLEEKNQK